MLTQHEGGNNETGNRKAEVLLTAPNHSLRVETEIVHFSHRLTSSYWLSHSINGIYSRPEEVNEENHGRCYPYSNHPPRHSDGPLLSVPINLVPVAQPAPPPPRNVTSHRLPKEETSGINGTWHTHEPSLCSSCWQSGWGRGRTLGLMLGTT